MERNSGESRMKLTHLEGDTSTQMSMIDAKTRQMVDEVKNMMTNLQGSMESERERSEQRILAMIEKNGASKDLLIVSSYFANDNNANDRIERGESRFLQSPHCAAKFTNMFKWSGRNCVKIMGNTSSAFHVQHVICHVV